MQSTPVRTRQSRVSPSARRPSDYPTPPPFDRLLPSRAPTCRILRRRPNLFGTSDPGRQGRAVRRRRRCRGMLVRSILILLDLDADLLGRLAPVPVVKDDPSSLEIVPATVSRPATPVVNMEVDDDDDSDAVTTSRMGPSQSLQSARDQGMSYVSHDECSD